MAGPILAIECGATSSSVILIRDLDDGDKFLKFSLGPANFALMRYGELQSFLRKVRECLKSANGNTDMVVKSIAIGMPGILSQEDRNVVEDQVKKLWPEAEKLWVGTDIEVALYCLEPDAKSSVWKCLLICGTGSVAYGVQEMDKRLKSLKVGGNGHLLGDRGSGYEIGLKALRNGFREWEREGESVLFHEVLIHTKANSVEELTKWSIRAGKNDIAGLASVVARLWTDFNDPAAKEIMLEAIDDLAEDFMTLVHRINPLKTDIISVGFAGSLLVECIPFAEGVRKLIAEGMEARNQNYKLTLLRNTGVGALRFVSNDRRIDSIISKSRVPFETSDRRWREAEEKRLRGLVLPVMTALPRTEERNPLSMKLDRMTSLEGIELMLSEESKIYGPIKTQAEKIATLIEKIAAAFKTGGRLFYVGAGTSGRLGVLDASECPPTFKAPFGWVQGIIAGGTSAMFKAVEGAEDSTVGGTLAMKGNGVNSKDIVLGIAASGRTPFVWGALYEAKRSGAYAAILSFNPNLEVTLKNLDMCMFIDVGPEVLTGSTRLKCGTATKSVLNMLTTLSMVRYGKCLENLMVDLKASNDKLRDRATRILLTILSEEMPDLTRENAEVALQKHGYDIKKTVAALRGLPVRKVSTVL